MTGYDLASNTIVNLAFNGLESGESKATVIVYDDSWRLMPYPGTGIGVNTDLVDATLFGVSDDAGVPASGTYYKTDKNLPWAINIPVVFEYPIEKQDITQVYLHFAFCSQ